ncbi:MAG: hypothetical protein DI634_07260, partial [Kocuria palustris]
MAAVLALLGALLVVAVVIGTAVHYAAQPDRLEAPTRSISVGCSPSRAVDGALVLPEAPGTV